MPTADDALFPEQLERVLIAKSIADGKRESTAAFIKRIVRSGIGIAPPAQALSAGRGELRGSSIVWPVEASRRHHPKEIRLCGFDDESTAFWVNLVIGCNGIGDYPPGLAKGEGVSKALGTLQNALRDLDSMRDFYQPTRVGELELVFERSYMRSAGCFAHTIFLADPDRARLATGLASLAHWLSVNGGDPEFYTFQINIFFSGHGDRGVSSGDSQMILSDGPLHTFELVDNLIDALVKAQVFADGGRIRLFIDSCHSAAIVRDFFVRLRDTQMLTGGLGVRNVACTDLLASSLFDEKSFDEEGLGNSRFTAAYLRENSARAVKRRYPGFWELPARSGGEQHPLLLRIEDDGGILIRFPALSALPPAERERVQDGLGAAAVERAEATGRRQRRDGTFEVIDLLLCQAECLRERCAPYINARARDTLVVDYCERRTKWG